MRVNDVHYLLSLAGRLEQELEFFQRRDWFRQSCERAIELAATARERSPDELWRIAGAGALDPHAGAVLRALWQWREKEAEMVDRPPFHILQNHELLTAAVNFASGHVPDYKQFSARRRQTFREAAKIALQSPQSEWPVMRRRSGTRPTAEMRSARRAVATNGATNRLSNLGWSHRSSRRAARSKRSQPIPRGQRPCWFPGNAS